MTVKKEADPQEKAIAELTKRVKRLEAAMAIGGAVGRSMVRNQKKEG